MHLRSDHPPVTTSYEAERRSDNPMNDSIHSRVVIRVLFACVILLLSSSVALGQGGEEPPGMLRNPLNPSGGADPWLTYYDGNYYLAATTWASAWTMRRSPTLAGLKTAEPQRIYFEDDPSRCCNFWAPEFRLFDGPDGPHWYFYYTAGTASTYDNQHTHVLESAGTDPLGPYTYKARLREPDLDRWMIDGDVLALDGELYFLYSAFGPLQSVYIAHMSNPWTIDTPGVLITAPEYRWETMGGVVNEGPVALHHADQTFIIFSASSCATGDYKLGMLTYTGDDPMSRDSWTKDPEPVFQRSDENGVFGPGHNGFFQSPDGTEDWIVYHAVDFPQGACNGRRSTRVQRINWNADGTPDFGVPVATSEVIDAPSGDMGVDPVPEWPALEITRFRSYVYDGAYLRHVDFGLRVDTNLSLLADSQFLLRPGLADPEAVSIESINFPGFFIRRQNNVVILGPDDITEGYAADATWWLRPGLADESAVSLETYGEPGSYLGKMFGIFAVVPVTDSTPITAREDATFWQETEMGN